MRDTRRVHSLQLPEDPLACLSKVADC